MEDKQKIMQGVIAAVWVIVCLGFITGFAAQLPPEILVDKYLLQATILSEEKDHKGALEAMDKIVALQKKHDLTLPEAFSFQYAQTALAAGSVQAAIASANRYLSATGREGKYYREALELLVKAERKLQEPAVDRVGSTPVRPDLEPQPQAMPPSSTQTQKTIEVQPAPDCRGWNTKWYFRTASVESVTACLAAGADPMARTEYKDTPLHWAARNRNSKDPAVIEALLAAGADPMARNILEATPLHWAAKYNRNPAMIEALLKAGADPKARDDDKETPLHEAAQYNDNPAVIEALLKAGGDARADLKWTPLHEAVVFNEDPGVIEALLKAGANPMPRDKWKNTPLHFAARNNENPAVIEALLKAGADPMARNGYKSTPLHWAATYSKDPAVIEALLKAGADPKARDDDKDTPLHRGLPAPTRIRR